MIANQTFGYSERTANSNGGIWADIETNWLDLYRRPKSLAGISVTKTVDENDEWCAEAFIATDLRNLVQAKIMEQVRLHVSKLFQFSALDQISSQ